MPEVPKIVYDRLRAASPGGTVPKAPHPDPDVLTAFAEQALSAAEREAVLQHLARCGDCRELVALSIPPMESSAQPDAEEKGESSVLAANDADGKAGGRRPWFAWPQLRWAALAAGIAVAGSILLIHPGKPSAVREAKQQPANTVARTEETIVAKKAVPAPTAEADAANNEKKGAQAGQAPSRDKESMLAYSAAVPPRARGADRQLKTHSAAKDLAVGAAVGGAVAAPTSPAPAPPQIPPSSETVEVTAASGSVATEEARNDLATTTRQLSKLPVNGRQVSDLAITKAKPAKPESNVPSPQPQSEASLQRSESLDKKQVTADAITQQQHAAAATNTAKVYKRSDADKGVLPQPAQYPAQWAIHGNELQRSLDAGVAWETVLHSDRPLLCYAAGGNDIWAGGKAGSLFHSANGGVTWDQVRPSSHEQTLADDVTHIDIYSPSQLVLSTSHQSWSTADGGKTWAKK
jgi:hypothetical protein